jgi:hypothetical protein
VHPPRFSSYHGYKNLLAEHIRVQILGHVGGILRPYLHDLYDHEIQACYRGGRGLRTDFLSRVLFAVSMPEIFGLLIQLVANPS